MSERLADDPTIAGLVEQMRSIEETLRDLAYDRLRDAVEAGAERVSASQRRLQRARRGIARAIQALDPEEAI